MKEFSIKLLLRFRPIRRANVIKFTSSPELNPFVVVVHYFRRLSFSECFVYNYIRLLFLYTLFVREATAPTDCAANLLPWTTTTFGDAFSLSCIWLTLLQDFSFSFFDVEASSFFSLWNSKSLVSFLFDDECKLLGDASFVLPNQHTERLDFIQVARWKNGN
jgi:hypothetical protein